MTTVVVGDRLPWPDEPSAGVERGPFDPGAIYHSGVRTDCVIRKISALGATIGSALAPPLGERVSLEIATGQRPAGKIAWTARGEIGVRFDDSIDVIALLNRQLVSQARERRTMPRLEVRATAHLKNGEQFRPATLRNISANGLQLEGDELPAAGDLCVGVRRRAEHSERRDRLGAGQPRRRRAARGAELVVDHPLGARDRASR